MGRADRYGVWLDTARHGVLLLVDETYRDLALSPPLPIAATLGKHVISVSSLSKAFGAPGIRVGWIVNTDPALQAALCDVEQVNQPMMPRASRFISHAKYLAGREVVVKRTV